MVDFDSMVVSIVACLFEIVFIYFVFIKSKNLNKNRLKIFLVIAVIYLLCGLLTRFNYNTQIWFHILFNILSFWGIKLFIKIDILFIDFFIIGYAGFILTLINGVYITMIINLFGQTDLTYLLYFVLTMLTMLFVMFFISFNADKLYKKYVSIWNRRDDGQIKAITVRNVSLICLNISIYIAHLVISRFIM